MSWICVGLFLLTIIGTCFFIKAQAKLTKLERENLSLKRELGKIGANILYGPDGRRV